MNTDTDARLGQITKIAQNARTSWFGLLALLAFVGVTLMGHEDADFFAFGTETELPLVNVAVPTVTFFIVAPVLLAGLYVYFHIYLYSLWAALAKCPPRIGNDSLEERVYPAMLCTSALAIRRRLRSESDKPVEGPRAASIVISVVMGWLFVPVVLGILWWRSIPYHHEWLTLWTAFWFWLTLIAGENSLFHLLCLMRSGEPNAYRFRQRPLSRLRQVFLLALLAVLAMISWDTTEGGRFLPLVPANLAGAELSRRPANWLHYDIWLEDWEYKFRLREGLDPGGSDESWPEDKRNQFRNEARARWRVLTQALEAPDLRGADLRGANLRGAFLSGANLGDAQLEGADLSLARVEGANFGRAGLEGASMKGAWLEGANLSRARLGGADLTSASLARAHLFEVQLEGTNFSWARLQGFGFQGLQLRGVDFSNTRLKEISFSNARLEDIDFRGAILDGVNFRGARLERVNFLYARGLTRPEFEGACKDQHSNLPPWIDIPPCAE